MCLCVCVKTDSIEKVLAFQLLCRSSTSHCISVSVHTMRCQQTTHANDYTNVQLHDFWQ